MARQEFYLTLPSNSNLELYPKNHGGEYTVVLNEPLYLDALWQVGLAEAVYTRDWNNIRSGENEILFEYGSTQEEANLFKLWNAPALINLTSTIHPGSQTILTLLPKWKFPNVDALYEYIPTTLTELIGEYLVARGPPKTPHPKITATKTGTTVTLVLSTLAAEISDKEFNFSFSGAFTDLYGLPSSMTFKTGAMQHSFDIPSHIKTFGNKPIEFKLDAVQGELAIVEPQRYFSAASLVTAINKGCSKLKNANIVTELVPVEKADKDDPTTYSLKITITPTVANSVWWRVHISSSLAKLVGISHRQQVLNSSTGYHYIQPKNMAVEPPTSPPATYPSTATKCVITGDFDVNLYRDVDALWVYTDIIEGQITGNTRSPLLRILPASSKQFGQSEVITYELPQYKRLSNVMIQRVNVAIYNSQGKETIDFKQPVVLTLHFIKGG